MNRLEIQHPGGAEKAVRDLYAELARRGAAAPAGNCPVEQSAAFIKLCLSQSCGKCVPCRIGLKRLCDMLDAILEGKADKEVLSTMENLAGTIRDSADCAIGAEAAAALLRNLAAFHHDFVSHIDKDRCTATFAPVPCRAGCPAHVDIPGYIALVKAGRFADAVRGDADSFLFGIVAVYGKFYKMYILGLPW